MKIVQSENTLDKHWTYTRITITALMNIWQKPAKNPASLHFATEILLKLSIKVANLQSVQLKGCEDNFKNRKHTLVFTWYLDENKSLAVVESLYEP